MSEMFPEPTGAPGEDILWALDADTDIPTDDQLVDWREADEYRNEVDDGEGDWPPSAHWVIIRVEEFGHVSELCLCPAGRDHYETGEVF